uniref:MAP6 domain containing 1 n=1 Tax=Anser brachyrhynchus TaxID=132585 RepID=A0A8B9CKK3_9AVES
MAWPCISRVCCLARFWSQLDKSDLSVPLTIHNYSAIDEPEEAAGGPESGGASPPPRGCRRPPATQYRRDFRAWPLPRRAPFPWGGGRAGAEPPAVPAAAPSRAACPLQEYRPWTGAKPSKPIKTKQGFIIPEDHFVQETSYKADFKIPEVKTRFSPNPSAVFQAPSRILNV